MAENKIKLNVLTVRQQFSLGSPRSYAAAQRVLPGTLAPSTGTPDPHTRCFPAPR